MMDPIRLIIEKANDLVRLAEEYWIHCCLIVGVIVIFVLYRVAFYG